MVTISLSAGQELISVAAAAEEEAVGVQLNRAVLLVVTLMS